MALKKTPLRRRSKSKATVDKADRALQDNYRQKHAGRKCEGCLFRPFDVMHHHIPKSQSNAGRYLDENLIFLCNGCHYGIHRRGDLQIVSRYSEKRGKEWVERMNELKKERRSHYGKKELEDIIQKYTL